MRTKGRFFLLGHFPTLKHYKLQDYVVLMNEKMP